MGRYCWEFGEQPPVGNSAPSQAPHTQPSFLLLPPQTEGDSLTLLHCGHNHGPPPSGITPSFPFLLPSPSSAYAVSFLSSASFRFYIRHDKKSPFLPLQLLPPLSLLPHIPSLPASGPSVPPCCSLLLLITMFTCYG